MISSTTPVANPTKSTECSTPFYLRVPKDLVGNLRFRQTVIKQAAHDKDVRECLLEACRQDILFFINVFCWTEDPRMVDQGRDPKLPFITYEAFQDEAILTLNENIGKRDILVEKSRDMGASWLCLTVFFYRWLFHSRESYLMVSRKETLVDGDEDSLFAHIDFLLESLPAWMIPKHKRNKLKLVNLETKSKIEGESTNENIGRGGRRTAMLIDEFAAFQNGGYDTLSATADNTRCRIFNSTPNGTATAFYSQRQKGTFRLRFHWSQHPDKGRGLYKSSGNGYRIIDEEFWEPLRCPDGGYYNPSNLTEKYRFKTEIPRGEERVRSPWYDGECDRRAHKVEIATQLDIDYQGSAYPYFEPLVLEEIISETVREPNWAGDFSWDSEYNPLLTERDTGNFKFWGPMDENMRPALKDRNFVIGCDISQGTGASNSVAAVIDLLSGTKAGELATNSMTPDKFARCVYALAHFFTGADDRPAFVIWEAGGPGDAFGKVFTDDLGFLHVYYKTDEGSINPKISDRPGFKTTPENKTVLLNDYRSMITSRDYINLSEAALVECGEYVYQPNGRVEHGGAVNTVDPSDTGANHGDRVIADALAAKILKTEAVKKPKVVEVEDMSSFKWRREARLREQNESSMELWEAI